MKIHKVLGMMSGTSLDGLDLAYCHFWESESGWEFKIEKTKEIGYSKDWRDRLKNAIGLSDEAHAELDLVYGEWLGEQARIFIEESDIPVDFIASHGHTSHHRPEDGVTFQLGNGQVLADSSNLQVICDFRSQDVKLGGQGAPLVPIGDSLLFNSYDFCLNLGGISNVSFQRDGKRIAFDIGMANMPLNHITEQMGLAYDEDGQIASKGNIDEDLLAKLNGLAYYDLPYPKSTGYEWFIAEVLPLLKASKSSNQDLLHTLIHHNCIQIAKAIHRHVTNPKNKLLTTGGGALNSFFIAVLQEHLGPTVEVVIPSKTLIAYKEALVFAFMGVLRSQQKINVLSSVTGADSDSVSGAIFQPQGVN